MAEEEFETAAAAFFEQMKRARSAGKDWWVNLQMRQMEDSLWRDKKIAELTHALEMVRDAQSDLVKDGLEPHIPPIALATINRALERAALPEDPEPNRFLASFREG